METVRKMETKEERKEEFGISRGGGKLLSVDNIAYNTLFENTFHSNLVPDISKVDYLEGNRGRTDLQPLEGQEPFVDDLYIFGYCRKEEMDCSGNRVWYKKSTNAAAKVVGSIAGVLAKSIYADKKYHVSIQNTTRKGARGTICNTIRKIEEATDGRTRRRWLEADNIGEAYTERLEDQNAVVAVFVAKVDLSEYSLEETRVFLPRVQRYLEGVSFGIFSIDYTQDFSGTLDRGMLVGHLESIGCTLQGERKELLYEEDVGTILDNTNTVGNHVCTRVRTYKGLFVRCKIYNKIVCQFETGTVQQTFGGHLADYVACPNKHLRKTFEDKDAKERGISRIEISVYGCTGEDPLLYGVELLEETRKQMEGKMLFLVQPAAKHWENFAKAIDRCCMFVDRPKREIHFCWYGHSTTRRLGGVVVPTGNKDIEKVARACGSEFGFHSCPIFWIDFLGRIDGKMGEGKKDTFSPLRCFAKQAGSKTVLCPSKKPTKKYDGEQDPSLVLFPTKHIHWKWKKSGTRIGTGKESTNMQEIPTDREISNIGWRERERTYNLLEEERKEREWKHENVPRVDVLVAERKQEILRVAKLQEEREKKILLLERNSDCIRSVLGYKPTKVHEIEDLPKKLFVLGYKQTHGTLYGSGNIYILFEEGDDDFAPFAFPVWATKRLDAILGNQCSVPATNKAKDTRVYMDVVGNKKIEIEVREKRSFCTKDGIDRFYCPIDVLRIPDSQGISFVDEELEKMYKAIEPAKDQRLLHRPTTPKDRKTKLADFAEGEYVCSEYSTFQYRGETKYVLFLGEEGKSATGYWIDEEMRKIVDIPLAPMLCKVGKMARTRNGHKGRKIVLCIAEEKWKAPPLVQQKPWTTRKVALPAREVVLPKPKAYIPPTFRTEEKEPLGDFVDRCLLEMGKRPGKSRRMHTRKDCKDWFGTSNEGLLEGKV